MSKTRRILALLCAAVLTACTTPAAAEETAGTTQPGFTIETEETGDWSLGETAEAWENRLEILRREGLETPFSETGLLASDPDAGIEREDGRIFMIRTTGGLGSVNGAEDAFCTAYRLVGLLGGNGEMGLRLRSVATAGDMKYYLFQHEFEGLTVVGSEIKIATDSTGTVRAVLSSLSAGNPETTGAAEVSAEEAENAVREELRRKGLRDTVKPEYTFRAVLPAEYDVEAENPPDRLAWVVFSENQAFAEGAGTDLPFLAHYVEVNGTYLHSCAVSYPGDRAARGGYATEYVFDGMERQILTTEVENGNGERVSVSVPVMTRPGSGTWVLGDPERRIAVAEFAPMIYGENRHTELVTSGSMEGWEACDLIAYRNIIRVWDYYAEMGWKGPDGTGTPVLMLRGLCLENGDPIENACYVGLIDGWQCFGYSEEGNLTEAMDVMAHEFAHGVTTATMNSNLYEADYGAINEAMSDILGNICEMELHATEDTTWLVGENTGDPIRSQSEPHLFDQPEYVWDIFYTPGTAQPNDINDRGGVHSNSSILNLVAAKLCLLDGMSLEEARIFWLNVACAMTPRMDYPQMAALLPWAAEVSGNGAYRGAVERLTAETRMGLQGFPTSLGEGQRLVTLRLPETEAFEDPYWVMLAYQLDMDTIGEWARAGWDLAASALLGTENDGSVFRGLLEKAGLLSPGEEVPEEPDTAALLRFLNGLITQHVSWTYSAENREIQAVMRERATVYLLVNMDPDTMDLRALELYADGEWISMADLFTTEPAEGDSPDMEALVSLGLRLMTLLPSLLEKQDPSVRWIELPAAGLENVELKPVETAVAE